MPKKPTAQQVTARFQLEAMASLRPQTTGIEGAVVWVSVGEFAGSEAQHGPRIKVVVGSKLTSESLKNSVTVTLTKPPKLIGTLPGKIKKQILEFVEKNREALLQHWNAEIDSIELGRQLKKV